MEWASERHLPTEAQWDAYRAKIEELYSQKTLKEVVDVMRKDFNFKAS